MDIIVQGTGIKNYTPNEITLSFDFKTVDSTYEKALELGVKNVETYIELLLSLGFKKEDFKTNDVGSRSQFLGREKIIGKKLLNVTCKLWLNTVLRKTSFQRQIGWLMEKTDHELGFKWYKGIVSYLRSANGLLVV